MHANSYLKYMGIEQWRLRDVVAAVTPSIHNIYFYRVGDASTRQVTLLFDADLQTEQEAHLAEAIVKAMQLPYCGGYQALFTLPLTLEIVVLLGPRVAEFVLQQGVGVTALRGRVMHVKNLSIIVSHPLRHLLNQRVLKAETWQDIQLAMQLLT